MSMDHEDWPHVKAVSKPDALFLFSLTLDSNSCWRTCAGRCAIRPYCHRESFVKGACHLLQIRACTQAFNATYSLYIGVHWVNWPKSVSRRTVSIVPTALWNLLPAFAPCTLMGKCTVISSKQRHTAEPQQCAGAFIWQLDLLGVQMRN